VSCYKLCHQASKARANRAAGGAKNKKFELTEEQKQEIREAFDLFDTDGSGKCVSGFGRKGDVGIMILVRRSLRKWLDSCGHVQPL